MTKEDWEGDCKRRDNQIKKKMENQGKRAQNGKERTKEMRKCSDASPFSPRCCGGNVT